MPMKKGFTLVEIIIALMIFSIVAVVALAALVRILDANKKAQTIQDSVVSMSFTMESMTRELRTGSTYYCVVVQPNTDLSIKNLTLTQTAGCNGLNGNNGVGVGFAFYSSKTANGNGQSVCQLINAYEIVPNMTNGVFNGTYSFKKAMQTACNQSSLSFIPVIDTNSLSITNYFVQMNNTSYPLLFVKLDGISGNRENSKTYFSIQTAASPRIP